MDTRQDREIKNLKRVAMSLTDIKYAATLIKEIHNTAPTATMLRAAEEAIIISYSRPFSGNDNGNLKVGFLKYFTEQQKKTHRRVSSTLRNKIVAHSDSTSYGVSFTIFKTGEIKFILPRQRRITQLLTHLELETLASNCNSIESWLLEEQNRIKNLLPCGAY